MEKALISVVMPVYNSEKYVSNAIESVLKQTYQHWELIIIDDGSLDQSVEIVEQFAKRDDRIKLLVNTENCGIAKTRNRGIEEAEGQYIAFLDSDDAWYPEKLKTQVSIMLEKNLDFSCTSYSIVNEENERIGARLLEEGNREYSDLLKTNFVGCLTAMLTKKLLDEYPMPNVKHEDYATWLTILKQGYEVYVINQELSIYTKRSTSVSSNKVNTINWVWIIYRDVLKLSSTRSFFYMLRFLTVTSLKYVK